MLTNIKLSRAQLSKMIQSVGFLGKTLDNIMKKYFSKKIFLDLAVRLAKDILSKLATKTSSSVLGKLDRKTSGKGIESAGKEFMYFK